MPDAYPAQPHSFSTYPKVELHRHLEGSLRLETLMEVAREHGFGPATTGQLRSQVQIGEREPFTADNFLSKFATLRLFYRSPEIITRVTREAIADAAADQVRYMELRFTPVALSRVEGFPLNEVMDWVIEAARAASQEYSLPTRLIASFNRHESVELAEQVTRLAVERISGGVVGLDVAGREATDSALPFAGLLREARQAGLHITVHAGEWNGAQNVREAIETLQAERIGHGVRVIEDPEAVAVARIAGAAFEVCLTSNFQSGVVSSLASHPLPHMLAAGLKVTLNTDDPSISGITLADEYRLACEVLGLSAADLRGCVLNAAQAAFLPPEEKAALAARLEDELD